jgi:hypothetical protein
LFFRGVVGQVGGVAREDSAAAWVVKAEAAGSERTATAPAKRDATVTRAPILSARADRGGWDSMELVETDSPAVGAVTAEMAGTVAVC